VDRSDNVQPIMELRRIAESRALADFLYERKLAAQKEVNSFVRTKDFTEAYAAVKRLDDISKFTELLNERISKLDKEIK